ncbi:DUF4269 domain-containing protein [Pedobacter nototheniae]|uniref:DUF4269 domain-containing protein n=1 Tax=Pedobacter nototheniae TaxID=2488994 RepID=UPI00103BCA59|nr:DUF4269 domain-containing protein [Pedobacter nototheniae]
MINFLDISYLKTGNATQVKAYYILKNNEILNKLKAFSPILVGTIPINIDIEGSDLDIVCYVQNNEEFKHKLKLYFGNEKDFLISENQKYNAIKVNFFLENFEIEIFGQNIPTQEQNAYLHMLIEHKLLLKKGENFRKEIIALKKQGYKTEPAFAKLLGLRGNPYQALLNY